MKKLFKWLKPLNFFRKKEIRKTKFQIGDCVMSAWPEEHEWGNGVVVDISIDRYDEVHYTIVFDDGTKAHYEEDSVIWSLYYQDFQDKINDRIK